MAQFTRIMVSAQMTRFWEAKELSLLAGFVCCIFTFVSIFYAVVRCMCVCVLSLDISVSLAA